MQAMEIYPVRINWIAHFFNWQTSDNMRQSIIF